MDFMEDVPMEAYFSPAKVTIDTICPNPNGEGRFLAKKINFECSYNEPFDTQPTKLIFEYSSPEEREYIMQSSKEMLLINQIKYIIKQQFVEELQLSNMLISSFSYLLIKYLPNDLSNLSDTAIKQLLYCSDELNHHIKNFKSKRG